MFIQSWKQREFVYLVCLHRKESANEGLLHLSAVNTPALYLLSTRQQTGAVRDQLGNTVEHLPAEEPLCVDWTSMFAIMFIINSIK